MTLSRPDLLSAGFFTAFARLGFKAAKELRSEGMVILSTPFQLQIPRALLDAMLAQARAELPNECCGLLAGHLPGDELVVRAVQRYPLANAAASPTRYEGEPRDLLRAFEDMRE